MLIANEVAKDWELQFFRPGPTGQETQYLTIRLTNAVDLLDRDDDAEQQAADLAGLETYEEVEFVYQKIEWTWVDGGLVADGRLGGAGWPSGAGCCGWPTHWVWDSWIADDGERYHLFFLKAPRALGDPALRHTRGDDRARDSTDLVDWDVHADALLPDAERLGRPRAVDRLGRARRRRAWRMYYTALSSDPGHGVKRPADRPRRVRRPDHLAARRRPAAGRARPALVPHDRRHRASETWRDPFVFADPDGDGWHMLITARHPDAPRFYDGVLAHARSADLVTWELRPPLTEPAGFGQIEVPQVRVVDGRHVLVFTCHPEEQSAEQIERFGRYSTWSVLGDLAARPVGHRRRAAVRGRAEAVRRPARPAARRHVGVRRLPATRSRRASCRFEILDPIPVGLVDGTLRAG